MTAEDLSQTFGVPAASQVANPLANRLAPRPVKAPAPVVAPVVELAAAPDEPPPPAERAPAPAPRAVQRFDLADAEDAHEDSLTSQISVYVLPAVVTAVRRGRRGRSNAQIAFEAITAVQGQLADLVAAHRRTFGAVVQTVGLFAPQPSDRRARSGERRVLWTFKATKPNQETLDRLVTDSGAQSRSELVAAALEAHLLPRRRRPTR